jgi:hypothetical protein
MFTERRERSHSIGLGEGDFMPEEKILPHMKPMILAKNDPAIAGVFPHMYRLLRLKTVVRKPRRNRSKLEGRR